jgi:hypothetical protein
VAVDDRNDEPKSTLTSFMTQLAPHDRRKWPMSDDSKTVMTVIMSFLG